MKRRFVRCIGRGMLLLLCLFPLWSLEGSTELKFIQLSPSSPSMIRPTTQATYDRMEVNFSYSSTEDFYVYVIPLDASGNNVSHYSSGSPLYAAGNGDNSTWCSTDLAYGEFVKELFLYAVNADQNRYLWWARIPVDYIIGHHRVEVTSIDTLSPAMLLYYDHVTASIDYETDAAQGIQIWAWADLGGASVDPIWYQAAPKTYGSGSITRYFYCDDTEPYSRVDGMRIVVWDEVNSDDFYIPVDYRWCTTRFRDMSITGWDWTDARFEFSVPYETIEAGGIRVVPYPIVSSPEELTFSFVYGGVGTMVGSGNYSTYINLNNDLDRAMRAIQMRVRRASDDVVIDTIRFPLPQPFYPDSPVLFTEVYVQPAVTGYVMTDLNQPFYATKATIPLMQDISTSLYAWNASGIDYRMFARPGIDGILASGYAAEGVFNIPSTSTWMPGTRKFMFSSKPEGALTEVLLQVYPLSVFDPLWRVYKPVDLTILDSDPPAFPWITRIIGGGYRISWNCDIGMHACVHRSFDLENWSPVSDWFRSYGYTMNFTDDDGPSHDRVFYKVEVQPPGLTPAP